MSELRVALSGQNANLGEVAAADVALLILGVERALSRAASVIVGRPKLTTGRYEQIIERSVRLTLRAIEKGSVIPVLEVPSGSVSDNDVLKLEDRRLGEAAIAKLLDAVHEREPHPVIAKALFELTENLRLGERYEAVTFDSRGADGDRVVRVDGADRLRLRAYVQATQEGVPIRSDAVVGVLVEADFERHTARLRTPTEAGVLVTFADELADDIQAALRQQHRFRGEVVFDPHTSVARSVRLQHIERGEQLVIGLDADAFWRESTFEQLAQEQGSGDPIDPDDLFDAHASEAERDSFAAAIAEIG